MEGVIIMGLFMSNQLCSLICLTCVLCLLVCVDKVFDPSCMTQKVYEEGARDVALSALNGINGNI